jgi:hypothetical protein
VNFGFALKLQTLLVHDQPQLALPQSDAFVHVLPPPDALDDIVLDDIALDDIALDDIALDDIALDEASALLASTEDAASVDVAPAPP